MGSLISGAGNRYLRLIPRSGSHSIAAAWLQDKEPDGYAAWQANGMHPARYLASQVSDEELPPDAEIAVVVRHPVERFRSMVARHARPVSEQLDSPMYGPLPQLPFTQYFRFEDELQACAEWLGISSTVPVLAESEPSDKPTLTPQEEASVREIYAADIALWESLQP